jgi:hypothetical protein
LRDLPNAEADLIAAVVSALGGRNDRSARARRGGMLVWADGDDQRL